MDRTKFDSQRAAIPTKPVHPLGWACENCFHVVKDTLTPQMKCCRNPPSPQFAMMPGGAQAVIAISPPVQLGEWCGEFRSVNLGQTPI